MRFKFPVDIQIVSRDTVEIVTHNDGVPIISVEFCAEITNNLTIEQQEKIYDDALTAAIRGSLKIVDK